MAGILALEEPLGGLDSSIPVTSSITFSGSSFYKRLCDVWEEEYEQRLAQYKDLAEDLRHERKVAVKVLKPELAAGRPQPLPRV